MQEKYFGVDDCLGRQLIAEAQNLPFSKRGIDRRAYLLREYAVLSTSRLKLRNAEVRDDELLYLDEIIKELLELHKQGVGVVPILGYCCDPSTPDGTGYMIQQRAMGAELYDDAILSMFCVWTQKQPEDSYLSANVSLDEAADYLCARTHTVSQAPQEHFDRLIRDMLAILKLNLLVDCFGKSNFFYDSEVGFQFIDIDSHNDYYYGLSSEKPDIEKLVSICGFTPCHYAEETEVFAHIALDNCVMNTLSKAKLQKLKEDNQFIFEKCKNALQNNGIAAPVLKRALKRVRIYGV